MRVSFFPYRIMSSSQDGELIMRKPGTQLGPYEILSPLGAGDMGEAYRPRDTRIDLSRIRG